MFYGMTNFRLPNDKQRVFIDKSDSNKPNLSRYLILKLINHMPGIRYNDLKRITKFNNGTLSHYLKTLEKDRLIRAFRCSKGRITRYYSSSISSDDFLIIGYLKSETPSRIILFLYYNSESTFEEIKLHIRKASSTTSWNLGRLINDDIIVKSRNKEHRLYFIRNLNLVTRVIENPSNLYLDRAVLISNYTSLFEYF